MGTAPRRISEPLAADSSSGRGSIASPVRWNRASWVRVVMPISKQVEGASVEQGLGQAQCHRGVVGPLARLQAEGPSANHVGDRLEGAWRAELKRRAHGVAAREPEQRSDRTVELVHRVPIVVCTSCPVLRLAVFA
jgi:hypothetical protein